MAAADSGAADEGEVIFNRLDEDEEASHEDVWDDTLLIRMYDRAVTLTYVSFRIRNITASGTFSHIGHACAELLTVNCFHLIQDKVREHMDVEGATEKPGAATSSSSRNENAFAGDGKKAAQSSKKMKKEKEERGAGHSSRLRTWKVGDRCLAPYYEDNLWYPSIVVRVDVAEGVAQVRYEDYDETEQVDLDDLCRRVERREAAAAGGRSRHQRRRRGSLSRIAQGQQRIQAGQQLASLGSACARRRGGSRGRIATVSSSYRNPGSRNSSSFVIAGRSRKRPYSAIETARTATLQSPEHRLRAAAASLNQDEATSLQYLQRLTCIFRGTNFRPEDGEDDGGNAGGETMSNESPRGGMESSLPESGSTGRHHQQPQRQNKSAIFNDSIAPPPMAPLAAPIPSLAPPPPPMFAQLGSPANDDEALAGMLMSWYMSGYHTGYYQAMQDAKKQPGSRR